MKEKMDRVEYLGMLGFGYHNIFAACIFEIDELVRKFLPGSGYLIFGRLSSL